jgi:hypothetical protein
MPGSNTPNLGLTVPTVGGDFGVWGGELNTDLAILDALGVTPDIPTSANITVAPTQPITIVYATGGGGGITVTLPSAAANAGRTIVVKKMDATAGAITIAAASGAVEITSILNQGQAVWYHSDGTKWNAVGAF